MGGGGGGEGGGQRVFIGFSACAAIGQSGRGIPFRLRGVKNRFSRGRGRGALRVQIQEDFLAGFRNAWFFNETASYFINCHLGNSSNLLWIRTQI
jgi:hypothetical protein